ncbi:MAG: site-2 protease family protein [Candidatus Rifleibacteriota bacterium]
MPKESFDRLIIIVGLILFLFALSLAFQSPKDILSSAIHYIVLIPVILISLTFHELAHALMADFLGDPTPRRMGRITLNPLRHLDILGAMMLFIAGFGWAKPVRVDSKNFRVPAKAMAAVAIVGPLSNFSMAAIGMLLMKGLAALINYAELAPIVVMLGQRTLETFIVINLGLGIFNLLPFPPLDGSRIVSFVLPARYRLQYHRFEEVAPFILLILFALGGLGMLLTPLITNSYSFLNNITGNPIKEISLYLFKFTGGVTL